MRKIIIKLFVLTGLIVIFFKVGEYRGESQYAAEQYAEARAKGDWEAIYDMLNIPDSKLLTKEMFLSTRPKDSVSEMSNYRVEACDNVENDYFQTYYCEYIKVGEEDISSEEVTFVKRRERIMCFFDDWEAISDELVVRDIKLTVPHEATLWINGINVDSLEEVEKKESLSDVTYVIPKMFSGMYNIEVKAPGRIPYYESAYIQKGYLKKYMDMEPYAEDMEELTSLVNGITGLLLDSVIKEEPFEEFQRVVKEKYDVEIWNDYHYDSLLWTYTYGDFFAKVRLDDVYSKVCDYGHDYDTGIFYVTIKEEGTMQLEGYKPDQDYRINQVYYTPFTMAKDLITTMQFEWVDGEWKLNYFMCQSY